MTRRAVLPILIGSAAGLALVPITHMPTAPRLVAADGRPWCERDPHVTVVVEDDWHLTCDVQAGQRLDIRFRWDGSSARLERIRSSCDLWGGRDLTAVVPAALDCEQVDH